MRSLLPLAILVLATAAATPADAAERWFVYVGAYTRGTASEGICVLGFDGDSAALEMLSVAGGVENPSFLALHPNGRFLYSADEVGDYNGESTGAVSAFAIDPASGGLSLLNRQSAQGADPCHVCVDPSGRCVLAVAYSGGTVAALPIAEDGRLSPATTRIGHKGSSVHPQRQTSPHPHQIVLAPDAPFALVPDLGLDRVMQYRLDAAADELSWNDPAYVAAAPGAGPRHLAFHPNGSRAYVINELDLTIDQFDYDAAAGTLGNRRTVAMLPEGVDRRGVSGAEIAVHPDGRTLYASLRGTDEIVAFRLDAGGEMGKLVQRIATGGKTPRNFALCPNGEWLLVANQDSGTIVVFRVGDDGRLGPTGQSIDVPAPVCLAFLRR